ncbi:aspartate kinase [Aerococcus agrisoli]|uniref:Aspartokinase n=1 Tax=Aerococcus agrisoli TaxID=2487350 RepID=A0A3N4GIC8_9LACT|nr:aspartate kinase [Aerococcus agrisoli]RPA58911.1 aspartate kinase [Aerococcus agrisoli]
MKVIKFGGSSVASAEQLEKVKNIVLEDTSRKFVIVSAPGKRDKSDIKVTDLLIDLAAETLRDSDNASATFNKIIDRFRDTAEGLNMDLAIVEKLSKQLNRTITDDTYENTAYFTDAVKAFGEDANAQLIAAYFSEQGLDAVYMNPQDAGLYLSDNPGHARVLPESYQNLYKLRKQESVVVIPGFFGYTKTGKLVTFSRGGSDITGAIVANGVKADMYENFTDVSSIYVANPGVVSNPVPIEQLTYSEMRELSYAGFSVFHDEALQPAFIANIPVAIKNTNEPQAPGTLITRTRPKNHLPISGIASTSGFASVYIQKYMMNREVGFVRRVLSVLEKYNVSFEHIVSGIDDIDVIFKEDSLSKTEFEEMVIEIKAETAADAIEKRDNISLLMIVGEGMIENIGNTARATKALSEAGINLEMINQGSSEISVMFGIIEERENDAVRAIYNEFFNN